MEGKEEVPEGANEQAELFAKLITYTTSSLLNNEHYEEDKGFGSLHICPLGPYILSCTHWSVV